MRRIATIAAGLLVAAVALYFVPQLLHSLFAQSSVSYLSLLTNIITLGVLALSWDILARTGQLSLAHAAFYGAGGYATAMLVRHAEVPLWMGIPLGGIVAGLLALLIGPVTLRLHGIYFAIATLSFTEVLRAVVQQLPSNIAGGAPGLNIPALFRPTFVAGEMERWEIAFQRNESYFLVYAGLLLFTILLSIFVQKTRLRFAFTSVRTNQEVASVMGVRAARTKLLAFILSSVPVGLLGAVEAHRLGSVNPFETFGVGTTVLALVTPIFGGLYTTAGPLIGATVLSGIEEVLRRNISDGYLIVYGVVLVVAVLFMPRGLLGLIDRLRTRTRRAQPPAAPAPQVKEAP